MTTHLKYIPLFLLLLAGSVPAIAQSGPMDSLRLLIEKKSVVSRSAGQDTLRRQFAKRALIAVSNMHHETSDLDTCKKGHQQVLDLMMQSNDSLGMAELYCMAGDHYFFYHNRGALSHSTYLSAKSYCNDLRSPVGQRLLSTLVLIYKRIGNLPKAIEYNLLLIDIFEKNGKKSGLAMSYRHLSELFIDQGRPELALEYARKSYNYSKQISEEYQRSNAFCYTIFSVSRAYMVNKDYVNAHRLVDEAIGITKVIDDKWAETDAWDTKGQIYKTEGKFEKAIECYVKGMNAKRSVNDTMPGLVYIFGNMADVYFEMKDLRKAIYYGSRALEMAKMLEDNGQIHSMAGILAESYGREKDFESAYFYSLIHRNLSDSLFSAEKISSMEAIRLEDDFNRKEAKIKEEREKEMILRMEEERKQRIITWSVLGGLAVVALFAGFVLRSLRVTRKQKKIIEIKNLETEKQKDIIEAKNRDITDSITYAKRLQQAKLPDRNDIYKELKDSFVLFKPKDIVSGDFYYFHKKDGRIFIASADCTGHGVPGAFMSIIGTEQLKDAVAQSSDPSEILHLLNKGMKASLRQSNSDDSTRDGMDIALCAIDLENNTVIYAGAYRPIWVIRKDAEALEEIRATKKAIGGLTADDELFASHELKLSPGDIFYLSTDGYADTFNGQNSKKLTTKKFKQVLMGIRHLSMQDQEKYLDNFIEDWKAGTEQVDDILVIGVRL